jgi:NRAMP (natural resistance-associated macrophage protein)-like metal ion transporter
MSDHKHSSPKHHDRKAGHDKPASKAEAKEPFSFRYVLKALGPGLITGASDDDPSGIGTYSQAGAQLGYGIGWTMLLSFPLMVAIQEISARVGRVTGHGISGNVCRHYSPWLLNVVVVLLFIANTVNIAADLAAMADATKLLIGGPGMIYVLFYGVTSVVAQIFLDYERYVSVLKWLTLSLFAYVAALAFAHVSWGEALTGALVPRLTWSADYFTTIVAILGTTISPYLFFWQAAQEVEEERALGRNLAKRRGATQEELRICRTDIVTGMFASNAIMYFIIMTTAATLHAHGQTSIATAQEAAEALRPLAGAGAYWLFTLGLIGTGMLAVPVLAGSCAYALAEALAWRGSLNRQPRRAKKFYIVLGVAMALGIALNYAGLDAIKLLFTTAVINGILAPPLILLVLLLTTDRTVMGAAVNSRLVTALGWVTFVVMSVAAVGLCLTS